MITKIEKFIKRAEELDIEAQKPENYADSAKMKAIMREKAELLPYCELYLRYLAAQTSIEEGKALLADPDRCSLAQEEISAAKEEIERISAKIEELLHPADPLDDRPVICEIRAGVGGEEAALFTSDLFRAYRMYAEKCGLSTEILNQNETELGGIKEIVFGVSGKGAYRSFKYESGVHRVQRVPETEARGRIQTSAVTVAVLPEATEVEIEIKPEELQIDTYRSGGAGGQHVNKTESAIRITHLPTGTVVECQDERSQYKNKDRAMKILRSRLLEMKRAEAESERADARRNQVGSGDRSGRIRTYNFPQGRVTDHRTGLTLHKLDAVMNGDFTELCNAMKELELNVD